MSNWPELSVEWYREQYAHNPNSIGVWAARLWEHYVALEAKLEAMGRWVDALLRPDYEAEAGIESILATTRGMQSRHRSFEAYKQEKLAAFTAAQKEQRE
jgi:hypothetical protein